MRLVSEHFNPRGLPKVGYESESAALAKARADAKNIYQCTVCGQFHLGGRNPNRSGVEIAKWLGASQEQFERCRRSRRYKNLEAASRAAAHAHIGGTPRSCPICGGWHLAPGVKT